MKNQTTTISEIGAKGDGLGQSEHGEVFIPFTLAGEVVEFSSDALSAELVSVIEPSKNRVDPVCAHFGPQSPTGACGGCSMQHVSDKVYIDWKQQIIEQALASQGLDVKCKKLVRVKEKTRRRTVLTATRVGKEIVLGFNEQGKHKIVPMSECHVLHPQMLKEFPLFKTILGHVMDNKPLRFTVLMAKNGFDISIDAPSTLDDGVRHRVINFIKLQTTVIRLSWGDEILIETTPPRISFGEIEVSPPSGGFVQACISAEKFIAKLVCGHLSSCKKVADLFSGCGTFALQLASTSVVLAVESEEAALTSLDKAFRKVQGLKGVSVETRDLFRRPLMALDLKKFQGVVFDPPRAGAEHQAKELAKSKVSKIAAVSCNPATLARDLRILVDGGFKIDSVTPIDQFLWTAHVEVVALLSRPE